MPAESLPCTSKYLKKKLFCSVSFAINGTIESMCNTENIITLTEQLLCAYGVLNVEQTDSMKKYQREPHIHRVQNKINNEK